MNKTTEAHNFTPIDKYTLTTELIVTVKGLLRIHDDPWRETSVPHYEQLNKQMQYVKDAIQRYEKYGTDRT